MKKVVFMALIALFTLSFTLEAQNNRRENRQNAPSGMRWSPKERADNMAKELGLTAEQKAKVEALFKQQDEKRAEEIAKQRDNNEGVEKDRDKRREEMQASREKTMAENDAALEKIIGKEKMEKWKQHRAELQKERRDSNRPERRGSR